MATIKISCGSNNDHFGKTTFLAAADGNVEINNKHFGKIQKLSSRIEPSQVALMVESLKEHWGMDAVSTRKGTAHEAIYEIESDENGNRKNLSVWFNDLKKYPAVRAVVSTVKDHIFRSSEGKMRL